MTDESFLHVLCHSKLMVANLVLLLLSLSLFVYNIYTKDQLAQQCLRAGYPSSKMVGWQDGYCIGRINHSDVVVSVKDLP